MTSTLANSLPQSRQCPLLGHQPSEVTAAQLYCCWWRWTERTTFSFDFPPQCNHAGQELDKNPPVSNEPNPAICYQEPVKRWQHKAGAFGFVLPPTFINLRHLGLIMLSNSRNSHGFYQDLPRLEAHSGYSAFQRSIDYCQWERTSLLLRIE